jgi:glycosyltransferase involved in cell wall biosynthesis
MNRGTPTVSVIIPFYNAAPFLAEAIGSILSQDPCPQEIIAVDDGSTDDGAAVVAALGRDDPRVRLISQPNQGIAIAVNTGLAHARGRVIAFLDADDLWLPGKQALQLAALDADPALDMVFAHTRQFLWRRDPDTGAIHQEELPGIYQGMVRSTMLAHRAVFERVGPFAPDPHLHDFFVWYARAQDMGVTMRLLPEVVHLRRIHGQNEGIVRRDGQRRRQLQSLKAVLDRRRQGG